MIEECKEIANDFLNTAGYQMPEGTKRIEYSEDNNQLKVTRVYKIDTGEIKKANGEKCIEITITFDIKDDLEIVGIGYYVDESEWFAPVILMVAAIIALAICNALDNAIKKQTKNKKR